MAKKATKAAKATKSASARPVLQFRVHDDLYESLKNHAAEKKMTISAAAASILSEHMSEKEIFPGIQQLMMWLSSGFWHALKMKAFDRGLSHDYAENGAWLNDPECFRSGALGIVKALVNSIPIDSADERAKTAKAIQTIIDELKRPRFSDQLRPPV